MMDLNNFVEWLKYQKQWMSDNAIDNMIIAGCAIYDVDRNYFYDRIDK
jgi:hypothetical protein